MSEKRICIICGVEFEPKNSKQKVCSNKECQKERRRQYMRNNAEMYRELNRQNRQRENVKQYRAEYDKEYQQEHKTQIQEYKKIWYQKQRFMKHLEKGKLLKNIYWFSLSEEEKQQVLFQLQRGADLS